jgi:peroxiredoxin
MNKRILFQYLLQLTLFIAAFGLVFFLLQWTRTDEQTALTQDDKSGMDGLSRGEVITLPDLSRLGGGTVSLGSLPEKYLLVGFFSASCSACSKESKFWRSLHEEATRRNVAFYLIAIDKEQKDVEQFAKANSFDDLAVLVDRTGAVAKVFEVTNVPMYVLLTSEGQVRERWIGLSHTNADDQRAKEPAQFFSNL